MNAAKLSIQFKLIHSLQMQKQVREKSAQEEI